MKIIGRQNVTVLFILYYTTLPLTGGAKRCTKQRRVRCRFQFFIPRINESTKSSANGPTKTRYRIGDMARPKIVACASFVPAPYASHSTAKVETAVRPPKTIIPKCLILRSSFSEQYYWESLCIVLCEQDCAGSSPLDG